MLFHELLIYKNGTKFIVMFFFFSTMTQKRLDSVAYPPSKICNGLFHSRSTLSVSSVILTSTFLCFLNIHISTLYELLWYLFIVLLLCKRDCFDVQITFYQLLITDLWQINLKLLSSVVVVLFSFLQFNVSLVYSQMFGNCNTVEWIIIQQNRTRIVVPQDIMITSKMYCIKKLPFIVLIFLRFNSNFGQIWDEKGKNKNKMKTRTIIKIICLEHL